MFLPSLISAPIETALERDYFMTGWSLLPNNAGARLTRVLQPSKLSILVSLMGY